MIPFQRTILILESDSKIAHRICQNYSKDFNIIAISNKDLSNKYDDVTTVTGDIYNDTIEILDDIIDYVDSLDNVGRFDVIVNNLSTNKINTWEEMGINLNKEKLNKCFEINSVLPYVIFNHIHQNVWSKDSWGHNSDCKKQIINLNIFDDEKESIIQQSSMNALKKIMSSDSDMNYSNSGVSFNSVSITGIKEKEMHHCALGVMKKLIDWRHNGEDIFIDNTNYKKLHKPLEDKVFRKKEDAQDIEKYEESSRTDRINTLRYHLKNINNLQITESKFKYSTIHMCVTDEIIDDINREFKSILDKGIKEKYSKNYFSNMNNDGTYSYVPDILSKSTPKNSKLIFINSTFKELLEQQFELELSDEVYIDYCYRKPGSKETTMSTGNDIVYFSPILAPVGYAFSSTENKGILNVFQSETRYTKKDKKPHMLRQKRVTVLIYLNDFQDFRGDGGLAFYEDKNGHETIDRIFPRRYSMLLFENNESSFYKFLPNESEEKMIRLHYHVSENFTSNKEIIDGITVKLNGKDINKYIPIMKPVYEESM